MAMVSDEYPTTTLSWDIYPWVAAGGGTFSGHYPEINRAWLMFDISSISSKAIIDSATLSLRYFYAINWYAGVTAQYKYCSSNTIDRQYLTWNNAPNASVVSDVVASYYNPQQTTETMTLGTVGLQAQVKANSGLYTLRGQVSDEDVWRAFYHTTPWYVSGNTWHYLTVTYHMGTEMGAGEYGEAEFHYNKKQKEYPRRHFHNRKLINGIWR